MKRNSVPEPKPAVTGCERTIRRIKAGIKTREQNDELLDSCILDTLESRDFPMANFILNCYDRKAKSLGAASTYPVPVMTTAAKRKEAVQ
jgi:hypothetical protein